VRRMAFSLYTIASINHIKWLCFHFCADNTLFVYDIAALVCFFGLIGALEIGGHHSVDGWYSTL
jgi:hypothetical protein